MKPLCIIGAGWHGRECMSIARDSGIFLGRSVFLDDKLAGMVDGHLTYPLRDALSDESFIGAHRFVVAIGNNVTRLSIGRSLMARRADILTLIHPTAILWSHDIGIGSVIFPHAIVSVDAKIGQFCIVNKRATVGHGAVLGDGVNLSDGVSLSNRVGDCASLGLHAAVIPGVKIGANAIVGAGAVVTRDVPDGETWIGVPARKK